MRLAGKQVLVTGATGFVAGRLVEKLCLEEGARVRALVRSWHKATWVSRTAAELVPGDVMDAQAIQRAAQDCEVVFHCASGGSDRDSYFATNVTGTSNILSAAKANNARVVYVSSIAVHGPKLPQGMNEDAPFVSTGKAYGDSKIAAEELLLERGADLPTVVIRPTFVWGPRSHLFTVGPLKAMAAGTFRLVDQGAGRCHAVHVDNLVESLILAGVQTSAIGRRFIVTDDIVGFTWKDFFDPLRRLLRDAAPLKSVSSRTPVNRLLAKSVILLDEKIASLVGQPAPLPRRVIRRAFHESRKLIARTGVPSLWDLEKYSQQVEIDLTATRECLGYKPIIEFSQAFEQTAQWVRDQLGDELELS